MILTREQVPSGINRALSIAGAAVSVGIGIGSLGYMSGYGVSKLTGRSEDGAIRSGLIGAAALGLTGAVAGGVGKYREKDAIKRRNEMVDPANAFLETVQRNPKAYMMSFLGAAEKNYLAYTKITGQTLPDEIYKYIKILPKLVSQLDRKVKNRKMTGGDLVVFWQSVVPKPIVPEIHKKGSIKLLQINILDRDSLLSYGSSNGTVSSSDGYPITWNPTAKNNTPWGYHGKSSNPSLRDVILEETDDFIQSYPMTIRKVSPETEAYHIANVTELCQEFTAFIASNL